MKEHNLFTDNHTAQELTVLAQSEVQLYPTLELEY